MTVVQGLGQSERDAGPRPDHRRLLDAELHGDGVGRAEADPLDIAGEPIRVFGNELDRVGAVGLENPHRPRRADAVAMEKDHNFANGPLLRPAGDNRLRPFPANAGHLLQPKRLGLDHVEDLFPKRHDEFLRIDRADAADHAGTKIFLDALDRCRRRRLEKPGAELDAMRAVVGPFAAGLDEFSGGDRRGMPNDGDEIALAPRFDAQNAKAILVVMERHPFDEPGEDFRAAVRRCFQASPVICVFRRAAVEGRTIRPGARPCRAAGRRRCNSAPPAGRSGAATVASPPAARRQRAPPRSDSPSAGHGR